MDKKLHSIIRLVIAIELLTIVFLVFSFYKGSDDIVTSITPISSDTIASASNTALTSFYEPAPGTTTSHHPVWLAAPATYTINRDGLNERYDYSTSTPNGVTRIVTLGDSWTFGSFVNTRDNYSERLEENLNNKPLCAHQGFEVINLGVEGYDLQYEAERYARRGVKYNPDLVILLLIDNDFDEINEFFIPKIAEHREALKAQRDTLEFIGAEQRPGAFGKDADVDPVLENAIVMTYEDFEKEFPPERRDEHSRTQLDRIRALVSSNLLVYTVRTEYNKIGIAPEGRAQIENFLIRYPSTLWYESDLMLEEEELFADGHPNHRGHQLIADDLYNFLGSNSFWRNACP